MTSKSMTGLKILGAITGLLCTTIAYGSFIAVQSGNPLMFSDKYGSFGYVGLMTDYADRSLGDPFDGMESKALSSEQIAVLFQKFCLEQPFDRAAYLAARDAVAADFRSVSTRLPAFSVAKPLLGMNNMPEVSMQQEVAPYGQASIWLGEDGAKLDNRPFARFSGSLIVTGPFETKNVYAPQCNLLLKVAGLNRAAPLIAEVEGMLNGFNNVKRVDKSKYGYATWTGTPINGRVPRVAVNASDLTKSEQRIEMTIQLLPPGKAK